MSRDDDVLHTRVGIGVDDRRFAALAASFDHPLRKVELIAIPEGLVTSIGQMAERAGCDSAAPVGAQAGITEDRSYVEIQIDYRRKA